MRYNITVLVPYCVHNAGILPQTATCDDLYKKVAEIHGNGRPLCVKDPIGDVLSEGKATLKESLYDGARLTAEYRQKWSLIILNQGAKSTLTVEVSAVCFNCILILRFLECELLTSFCIHTM